MHSYFGECGGILHMMCVRKWTGYYYCFMLTDHPFFYHPIVEKGGEESGLALGGMRRLFCFVGEQNNLLKVQTGTALQNLAQSMLKRCTRLGCYYHNFLVLKCFLK